jgi:hypothetical protein
MIKPRVGYRRSMDIIAWIGIVIAVAAAVIGVPLAVKHWGPQMKR